MGLGTWLRPGAGDESVTLDRRRFLRAAAGGGLAVAGGRIGYELVGYGHLTGTNLTRQDLAPLARRRLALRPFDLTVSDTRLVFDGATLTIDTPGATPESVPLVELSAAEAAALDARYDLAPSLAGFHADATAIRDGAASFAFHTPADFFARLEQGEPRPLTVAALRGDGFGRPSPDTLRAFAGRPIDEPAALMAGLAAGFRAHTHFDTTRYVGRWIEDYLLFDTVSLERFVDGDTTFDALVEGSTGLYCWEYTYRSIAAFHTVAPHRQSPPVVGAIVVDTRHNHMYTGLASAVRIDGTLRLPMTFLDYSHATMSDTYRLDWLVGDGAGAYDTHHRATDIRYTA